MVTIGEAIAAVDNVALVASRAAASTGSPPARETASSSVLGAKTPGRSRPPMTPAQRPGTRTSGRRADGIPATLAARAHGAAKLPVPHVTPRLDLGPCRVPRHAT